MIIHISEKPHEKPGFLRICRKVQFDSGQSGLGLAGKDAPQDYKGPLKFKIGPFCAVLMHERKRSNLALSPAPAGARPEPTSCTILYLHTPTALPFHFATIGPCPGRQRRVWYTSFRVHSLRMSGELGKHEINWRHKSGLSHALLN